MINQLDTIQIDWLSLVIEKRVEPKMNEEGFISVNPLLVRIYQSLDAFLDRNLWNPKFLTLKGSGVFIEESPEKVKLDLQGEFFLKADCYEKIKKLVSRLEGYVIRLTRIDYQITSKSKELVFSFTRCKFSSELESYTRLGKGQKFESFSTFNTRFKVLIYNKTAQIKKALRKRFNYLNLFNEKYGDYKDNELWRIEISLKYADQLNGLHIEKITTDKEFLIRYIQNKKFPKKIITFFKKSSFCPSISKTEEVV